MTNRRAQNVDQRWDFAQVFALLNLKARGSFPYFFPTLGLKGALLESHKRDPELNAFIGK